MYSESTLDPGAIRAQLERILAGDAFQHSRRYPALLRHVVEKTLDGATDDLKERTIGVEVFRRHPEYDSNADPVVRMSASEVRKRLEDYYAQAGHAGELRIVLPVGAYVPEFRSPPPPPRKRWPAWTVAVVILVLAAAGATLLVRPGKDALARFWEPVLRESPVLVVMETLMGVPRAAGSGKSPVAEMIDPKVFLVVSEINAKMAAYFGANGRTLEFELARNINLDKLRKRPFIVTGAFNNRLAMESTAAFRYYLHFQPEGMIRQILDRQDASQHWDSPMAELRRDYALIARAAEPRTGQTMVVIAGLGERGGAAATEFLTNPKYMERFTAQAPRGWEQQSLEIILETEVVNGDWGEPRIVATHVW
jgi:hypothetical protein